REEHKIDKLPRELLNKYGLILITDTAGMGKSTVMKKMYLSSIEEDLGLPIFIELRRIKNGISIIDEIKRELSVVSSRIEENVLDFFFEKGNFIFFFDGFDEIPNDTKQPVTIELEQFITKYFSNNYFFITSRPDTSLSAFGEFQEFKIKDLTLDDSFELIKKYDSTGKIDPLLISKLQEGKDP